MTPGKKTLCGASTFSLVWECLRKLEEHGRTRSLSCVGRSLYFRASGKRLHAKMSIFQVLSARHNLEWHYASCGWHQRNVPKVLSMCSRSLHWIQILWGACDMILRPPTNHPAADGVQRKLAQGWDKPKSLYGLAMNILEPCHPKWFDHFLGWIL